VGESRSKSCRLAYFIAKTAHSGPNGLLNNCQRVKSRERELVIRNGRVSIWRDKPPVIPRAPSFWTIDIWGCVLSVWGQGATTASVVQLLNHEPIPLAGAQREGMRCEVRRSDGRDREGERVQEVSHDEETTRLLFVEFTSHGCFRLAMDQSIARRTLQELIKREDLKNKSCVDCGNPNPQWASLRFVPFIPSTRHFPKTVLSASPYLSVCNARGFTEVSACTSGELIYVILSGFLIEYNPCIVLSAPYRWILGKRIKFAGWRYGTPSSPHTTRPAF
jgi:hypothetical protein